MMPGEYYKFWGWVDDTGHLIYPTTQHDMNVLQHEDLISFPIEDALYAGYIRFFVALEDGKTPSLYMEYYGENPRHLKNAIKTIENEMMKRGQDLPQKYIVDFSKNGKYKSLKRFTSRELIQAYKNQILTTVESMELYLLNTKKEGAKMKNKSVTEADNIFKSMQKMLSGEMGNMVNDVLNDPDKLNDILDNMPIDSKLKGTFKSVFGGQKEEEGPDEEPEDYWNDDWQTPYEKENIVYGWITKKGTVFFGSGESFADIVHKHLHIASETGALETGWVKFEFLRSGRHLIFSTKKDHLRELNTPGFMSAVDKIVKKANAQPNEVIVNYSYDKTSQEFLQRLKYKTVEEFKNKIQSGE